MRLHDYICMSDEEKKKYLDNMSIRSGLSYFGGKSIIGRYLFNHIFNLACEMNKNEGRKIDFFIDAFTGGGKLGLSLPSGWAETIVMNDMDYGVYSYYKCILERPKELIKMIEEFGKILNRQNFHLYASLRNPDKNKKMYERFKEVDELRVAALTFIVTAASYNNTTDAENIDYSFDLGQNSSEEKQIQNMIDRSKKVISSLHSRMYNHPYIIENLDYRELIKKYNGLRYTDLNGKKYDGIDDNKNKLKLWYFDPPYYQYTLHGGDIAKYSKSFSAGMTYEMTDILTGKKSEEYDIIDYFIKSDYDPKETLKDASINIKDEKIKDEMQHAFDALEKYPCMKITVGTFAKGGIDKDNRRTTGKEFIWCKGFKEGYGKEKEKKEEI